MVAAFAEYEARVISDRSRVALGAYKARYGLLGAQGPNGKALLLEARQIGAKIHREAAIEAYADIMHDLRRHRDAGASLRELVAYLNVAGRETRTGKPWNTAQVWRVLRYA
jgi:hypothetical protein